LVWDGRDAQGKMVGSGLYLVVLRQGGRRTISRIVAAR
jgi:hypothetical protein